MFFQYGFDHSAELWRCTVKKNAHAVNFGGKESDADGRGDQDEDRDDDFIPRDRTHTDSRKHRHRRGKGNIRAYQHCGVVDRSAAHREYHHHKCDNKEEGDRHNRRVDILQLGCCRAYRAKHKCVDKEAKHEEHDQINKEFDRNIEY